MERLRLDQCLEFCSTDSPSKRPVNRMLCIALIWDGFGFAIPDLGQRHGTSLAALESVRESGCDFGEGCE